MPPKKPSEDLDAPMLIEMAKNFWSMVRHLSPKFPHLPKSRVEAVLWELLDDVCDKKIPKEAVLRVALVQLAEENKRRNRPASRIPKPPALVS